MITTPQGFDLQGQEPLELKTVKLNAAARLAITQATTYDGLSVYQTDTQRNYQWHGTPAAGSWREWVTDGFSTSSFINVSTGVSDAGKPIILDAAGKIDASMLSASDLSLYYLLDGTRPLTGALNAGLFKLTNLANGSNAQDAVTFTQLSGYLPSGSQAADSAELEGQPGSYYLSAANLTGTISDDRLPSSISSDITGNAATASQWTTQRLLTLTGEVTGSVWLQGHANMSMSTLVGAHTHDVGDVTGTNNAFNSAFAGSGGYYGTAATVARSDHSHAATGSGITANTTWKDKDSNNRYGKFTNGELTETGAWVPMSGAISEATVSGGDGTTQDVTITYTMDPLESTGYIFQYQSGDSIVMATTGETGTGNTVATVTIAGPSGHSTIWELVDVYTSAILDTVTISIT